MSTNLLAVFILGLTAAVVIAIFLVLWRERTSAHEARLAIVSGVVLATWAIVPIQGSVGRVADARTDRGLSR